MLQYKKKLNYKSISDIKLIWKVIADVDSGITFNKENTVFYPFHAIKDCLKSPWSPFLMPEIDTSLTIGKKKKEF